MHPSSGRHTNSHPRVEIPVPQHGYFFALFLVLIFIVLSVKKPPRYLHLYKTNSYEKNVIYNGLSHGNKCKRTNEPY